jgi:hypothetical protein
MANIASSDTLPFLLRSISDELLIYESSLRAGHGWRESLYRHQGFFKASDCGRLGHQAAGHPWSALRVVKSRRKDCPTAEVLPRPKQQLCIQNGTELTI